MVCWSSRILLAVFVAVSVSSHVSGQEMAPPEVVDRFQKLVHDLGPDRAASILNLAHHWAPRFYAQTEIETVTDQNGRTRYIAAPQDLIVSPFFDDDDLRNNKINMEKLVDRDGPLPFPMYAEVPFLFQETQTHYFLKYIKYNAIDTGRLGFSSHAHDAEQVWMAIRKDGTPYGRAEVIVLNAHGSPLATSPDSQLEMRVRRNIAEGPIRKPRHWALPAPTNWAVMLPDVAARQKSLLEGFPVLASEGKHALEICDPLKLSSTSTCVYICQKEGRAQIQNCIDLNTKYAPTLPYSLLSMDALISDLYKSDDPDLVARRSKIFEEAAEHRTKGGDTYTNTWGVFRSHAGQPRVFVRGQGEAKPDAHFDWDLGIGGPHYSQPHRALQFLLKDPETGQIPSEASVSSLYLYNPLIEIESMRLPDNHRCQRLSDSLTNSWDRDIPGILRSALQSK